LLKNPEGENKILEKQLHIFECEFKSIFLQLKIRDGGGCVDCVFLEISGDQYSSNGFFIAFRCRYFNLAGFCHLGLLKNQLFLPCHARFACPALDVRIRHLLPPTPLNEGGAGGSCLFLTLRNGSNLENPPDL
jgi:hypothetical protein